MTEEDRYQNNAMAALELAKRVRSNEAKNRLLKLADAWRDLAKAARRSRKRVNRHGSFQRARSDLNYDAMLIEIGQGLRVEYAAFEEPMPERAA
jgi:hypothetical protein